MKSFYVQPVGSPTRACVMTGRYATHTGVYTIVRPGAAWGLPLNERTLPQALHETGYATAICGKWHLGEYQPENTLVIFSSDNGGPNPGRTTINAPLRALKRQSIATRKRQ